MAQNPPAGFIVDAAPSALPPGFKLDAGGDPPQTSNTKPQPGILQRFGEATGVPYSKETAIPGPSTLELLGGPAVTAGKAAYGYGKNILQEGKKALGTNIEAGKDILQGQPIGVNVGRGASANLEYLLRGPLGPFGGSGVQSGGEDFERGNYPGFAGDVLGSLVNALLLHRGTAPTAEAASNKLAFAAGKDTAGPIKATLPDLRAAASAGPAPKTVDSFESVVGNASRNLTRDANSALQPIAHTQIMPATIAQNLRSLITPNMAKTADGLQSMRTIEAAAKEFEQPWTLGELDAERMDANERLNPFYKSSVVDQYAKLGNRNTAIDKVIGDTIRDTIYPRMDVAAGKPQGYFRALKQRQGDLINLESSLKKETERLKDTTARIQGSPRFARENASIHVGASGVPRAAIYGLLDAIKKPNPLAVANRRVAQGFSTGKPISKAAISTLPMRKTLFPEENQ